MWIDVDVAFNAFLSHVCPRVSTHPFSLAFWTLVLPETSLLPLIRGQALTFRTSLWTVFDVMTLIEAQVTQVVGWRFLAGSLRFRGEREVREVFCQ